MGHRSRRRHGRAHFTGEPNGLQPGDDVGNRRSHKQTAHPPDDLGNRKEPDELLVLVADDIGNRVDLPPTHEISGVLADLDGRRRKKKKGGPLVRVGRYFVGGVNPLVSGLTPPPKPVSMPGEAPANGRAIEAVNGHAAPGGLAPDAANDNGVDEEGGGKKRRRRRRRREGREQVDGQAAQEVSERRAQRFFDFEEDDRFEYILKSDPALKCKDAEDAVRAVLVNAGRDAVVEARLLEDRDRPKVLVTIDERGAAKSLDPARRSDNADEPLFVLGNAALMSLNYLVNKIVNRYPDDRIRLAILPKADESLYLESLKQHLEQQRVEGEQPEKTEAKAESAAQVPAEAKAESAEKAAPAARAPRRAKAAVEEKAPVEAQASADEPAVEAPVVEAKAAVEAPVVEAPAEAKAAPKRAAKAAAAPVEETPAVEPSVEREVPAEAAAPSADGAPAAVEAEAPVKKRAPARKKATAKKVAVEAVESVEAASAEVAEALVEEAAEKPKRTTRKATAAKATAAATTATKKAPARRSRAKTAEDAGGPEEA